MPILDQQVYSSSTSVKGVTKLNCYWKGCVQFLFKKSKLQLLFALFITGGLVCKIIGVICEVFLYIGTKKSRPNNFCLVSKYRNWSIFYSKTQTSIFGRN